jgi:hypothetical protein
MQSNYWRNNLVELGSSLSGFLDKFVFFSEVVCQTNVLNPLLHSKHYPGIEPSTFGVAVGDANHCTIQTYPSKIIAIIIYINLFAFIVRIVKIIV